jgi:hypothetical protein
MRGKFEFKEGFRYHMPVHFREDAADTIADQTYDDLFMISADIITEMEKLATYVPQDFEILEPVLNVIYNDCRGVRWMTNGEYRMIQFGVPVRYLGNSEGLTGLYILVIWEDKTTPILTGREDTGLPKIYADISIERHWDDQWFVRAAFECTTFLKIDFWDRKEATPEEVAIGNQATRHVHAFGWRYIANVSGSGAALSEGVLNPSSAEMDSIQFGEAKITWPEYDWRENPSQAMTILGLSSLPILGVRNAVRGRGRCTLMNTANRVLP